MSLHMYEVTGTRVGNPGPGQGHVGRLGRLLSACTRKFVPVWLRFHLTLVIRVRSTGVSSDTGCPWSLVWGRGQGRLLSRRLHRPRGLGLGQHRLPEVPTPTAWCPQDGATPQGFQSKI